MASNSKHYGDVLAWIEKVINSCTTSQQTIVANKLLNRYYEMYDSEEYSVSYKLSELKHLQNWKWSELITEELKAKSNKLNASVNEIEGKAKTKKLKIKKSCATCYHVFVSNHAKPCNVCDKEFSRYLTKE